MKKIGILSSGGDAPGMNAIIRSAVRVGISKNYEIVGIYRGFKGLLEEDFVSLNLSSVADIIQRGGTFLESARCEEFKKNEVQEKAIKILKKHNIEHLIILGGDGSLAGGLSLQEKGLSVIGIPCTIDNDIGSTDLSIGFTTAVETVSDAITKLRDTSFSHGRANIIEVMGRECGDIALYSGLASGAESILVPEIPFTVEEVAKKIERGKRRGKRHHIIIMAEGVGNSHEFKESLEKLTKTEVRLTILGYVQRGGSPSVVDRCLGTQMGSKAIDLISEERTGRMICYCCGNVLSKDLEKALIEEKKINKKIYEIAGKVSI